MRFWCACIAVLASMGQLSCSSDSSDLPLEYAIGDGEPVLGAKATMHVSPEFSRQDTRELFGALQTRDLRAVLESVSCGENVPAFKYTVSLWRQAPMHVRHVEVREDPWLEVGRKNECLTGGLKFFVIKTVEGIERRRRLGTSEAKAPGGPPDTANYGLKGVSCDCVARANGLPSVEYSHWPVY